MENKKVFIDHKYLIRFLKKYYLFIAFLLLLIISSILTPKFLTSQNLINILTQTSSIAILSFGMLVVIISSGIDLSVGSMVALSVCLTAGLLNGGWPIFLIILFVPVVMALLGGISGGLVSLGKIEPFIATLAMQQIVRGLAYTYQVGSVAVIDNETFLNIFAGNIGIIPVSVIFATIFGFLMHFILKYTVYGRMVYALGGSKEAAKLVGIPVKKILISVYMISGTLAAFAGILMSARLRVGTALVGNGMELDAIASVVIGGAAFTGGRGTVINTVLGVLILGMIGNIMNLVGLAAYPQMMIKGLIIVVAVLARRE